MCTKMRGGLTVNRHEGGGQLFMCDVACRFQRPPPIVSTLILINLIVINHKLGTGEFQLAIPHISRWGGNLCPVIDNSQFLKKGPRSFSKVETWIRHLRGTVCLYMYNIYSGHQAPPLFQLDLCSWIQEILKALFNKRVFSAVVRHARIVFVDPYCTFFTTFFRLPQATAGRPKPDL